MHQINLYIIQHDPGPVSSMDALDFGAGGKLGAQAELDRFHAGFDIFLVRRGICDCQTDNLTAQCDSRRLG